MPDGETPRTAIVHDWLVTWRGAEKVVQVIWELLRPADVYTLVYERRLLDEHWPELTPAGCSPLQKWGPLRRRYRWFLPLFPRWVESWDLNPYDLVISSSHCAVKGVIPRPDALHLAYLYTPMRYAWDQRRAYFGGGWYGRFIDRVFLHGLRNWDVLAAHRVDLFLADSRFVARRIEKYYRRAAYVLPPPVATDFFTPGDEAPEHFLVVSALVPYKRLEPVLDAFRTRPEWKLVVVGSGPLASRLRRRAGPNVKFLGNVSDEQLRALYRRAHALIHPAVEDFGMNVAEALACGRPVIVYHRGGAAEMVEDGTHGRRLRDLQPETIAAAAEDILNGSWNVDLLRKKAENFDHRRFRRRFQQIVDWARQTYLRGEPLDAHVRVLDRILDDAD